MCVATGRMWPSAAPWVGALGADSPVILYNGGRVLDFETGRVLHERRLAAESTRRALDLIRRDPALQPHLFLNDRVYVERPHPLTDAYAEDDGLTCEVVAAFEPLLGGIPTRSSRSARWSGSRRSPWPCASRRSRCTPFSQSPRI